MCGQLVHHPTDEAFGDGGGPGPLGDEHPDHVMGGGTGPRGES
jgi:hypothetical protein